MELGLVGIVQGPMLIGFLFNVLLYGMMIAHIYIYYTTYKRDHRWMKLFVLLIFMVDTANTSFDFVYLYRALITHFGDTDYLATADWYFATDPAITGIMAVLVQTFFAWRLGVLTKSWSLVAVVCLGSISGGTGAMATSFEVGRTPHFVDFRNFKSVVIIWLASSAITDLIITTFLVWFLQTHKSGFKKSDLIINRIIRLTVQTGLITSFIATLDLIFFLASPSGLHLMFNFPLCKLYSNSLMSSLNARHGWKFESAYGESSDAPSGNLEIVLSSNMPTSPLIPSSPTLALRNIGDWYDNFNGDGGSFTSRGQTAHSDISSVTIPPGAIHLGKNVPPDVVESSFYELRDVLGSRRRERACSPTTSGLSIDAEMAKRVSSQTQDEDDNEEVYEEIIQLHNGIRGSRHQ